MRKFGYPDLIGIVAALVAVTFIPGLNDPLTYPKLLVLSAGGLALLPAAIWRWRRSGRNPWYVWTVAGAAAVLVLWGVVSMIGSGAPLANSLFGWWGRGDGWLALVGSVSLFLGGATLDRAGIARAITWLMGGATVAAFIGVLQVGGMQFLGSGGVTATMGNTNFAAGYFAMLFALCVGRALTQAALWQRIWAGVLAVVLAVLAYLTQALQGPVALAGGLIAFGIFYALAYRGRFRTPGLIAAGIVVVLGAISVGLSIARVGPLKFLWEQDTFYIRQQYWQSGWKILNALPVFGTGPDGFARYVSQYRPESYVQKLGPTLRVSAAHDIPLQIGATMGWVALIMWLIAMLGTVALLVVRLSRAPVAVNVLSASVGGALVAYLVQGIVSIDMLPVLATGWTVAGLTLAAAREALPVPAPEPVKASTAKAKTQQTRKERAAQAYRPDGPSVPVWVPVSGGVIGLIALIAVGMQISAVSNISSIRSQDEAISVLTSSLTPCPPRAEIASNVLQQLPTQVAVPALQQAIDLDERCAGMMLYRADVALQQGDLALADQSTAFLVQADPLFAEAWVLRGQYEVKAGDLQAAQQALDEAKRVNALYPDPAAEQPRIDELEKAISDAKPA